MNSQTNNAVRFELYAENRDGTLIVKNLEQDNYFIRKAQELAADKELLEGFSKEQRVFISSIVNPDLS